MFRYHASAGDAKRLPAKMEVGEKPARDRHCERGATFQSVRRGNHWRNPGREKEAMMREPGDMRKTTT